MIDEKRLIEDIKDDAKRILAHVFGEVPAEFIDDYLKQMEWLINDQPKVGEWIPFKEREADEEERKVYGCDMILTGELPEEDEDILVTYASGKVCSDAFLREGYECYLDSGAQFISEAIAWMPLPEAYKK